jgi:hypothetical protein
MIIWICGSGTDVHARTDGYVSGKAGWKAVKRTLELYPLPGMSSALEYGYVKTSQLSHQPPLRISEVKSCPTLKVPSSTVTL